MDGNFIKTSAQLEPVSYSSSLSILPGQLLYESQGNSLNSYGIHDSLPDNNNDHEDHIQNPIHSNQNTVAPTNNSIQVNNSNDQNNDLDPDLLLALQLQDEENYLARRQSDSVPRTQTNYVGTVASSSQVPTSNIIGAVIFIFSLLLLPYYQYYQYNYILFLSASLLFPIFYSFHPSASPTEPAEPTESGP